MNEVTTVEQNNEINQIETVWNPQSVKAQLDQVVELMRCAMVKDEDYGIIPGTNKPSLYKAGSEKLGLLFRFYPELEVEMERFENGHREYRITCGIYSQITGKKVGSGVGSCSTLESKYRWRNAERLCPECQGAYIIKGKAEYGGGWLCFAKKGGCGAKFQDGDQSIEGQQIGRKENEDIADVYNTVLKMAKKRAYVDAVITATGSSQIFTQDMEDMAQAMRESELKSPPRPPAPSLGDVLAIIGSELVKCKTTQDVEAVGKMAREKKEHYMSTEAQALMKAKYEELAMAKAKAQEAESKQEQPETKKKGSK